MSNVSKLDISEMMAENRLFQIFMDESIEPIFCFEFDKPISLDLPEDEQFKLFISRGYLKQNNRAYAQIVGYERREDMLGMRLSEIMPASIPENAKAIKQMVRAGYNLRDFVTVEYYRKKKFIVLNNIQGINKDGKLLRVWGSGRDITAQKAAEDELIQAEWRYRTIADFTYDWETWVNPDGSYNYVSPAFERITGYPVQQLVDRPELLSEIIVSDDLAAWEEHRQTVHAQHEKAEIQFRIRAKNGQIRWIEHICQPVYKDQGHYFGLRASNRDITERKMTEKKLREINERFRLSFKIANIAICMVSLEGRLLQVNDQMCKMFGYSKEELEAMSTEDIAHPEDLGISPKYIHQARSGTVDQERFVKRYIHKDGHIVWGEVSSTVIRDEKGNPEYFVSYVLDITERMQSEIKLRNAFKEIEQLKSRLEDESAYLQEEIKLEHNFENIIGNSDALKYMLYRVAEVAPTDAPVLIMGETGTGKELIARAIHNLSSRSKHPLVKINCAALPASMIESELFGHEKGAFTGADARRVGRFQLADGATLFLDEISEIPIGLQSKLLQVLQDGEFEPLGSSKTLRVDVRIIAASNRDLEDEVNHGRFRQDLFYRINVFPFTVPPLRNRKEDIPLLVTWFVDKFNRKMDKNITSIPETLIRHLQAYDWPGNVRELENVIERAAITSKGSVLKLTERLFTFTKLRSRTKLKDTLTEVEREQILYTLEQTGWKIEGTNGAAGVLGLAPSTLRDRIKKLGIRHPIK